MQITRQSQLTGKSHTREIPVTRAQLDRYYADRLLIHQAFPHLSPDDREFIKTGITPEEWNEYIPQEEE